MNLLQFSIRDQVEAQKIHHRKQLFRNVLILVNYRQS